VIEFTHLTFSAVVIHSVETGDPFGALSGQGAAGPAML
jgi:hypothetical protein